MIEDVIHEIEARIKEGKPLFVLDPKPPIDTMINRLINKKTSIGITFGCFIPFHTGHEAMIEESRRHHETTIIAVAGYDTDRGQVFIPFHDRITLMKEIYQNCPDVIVTHVDDHKIGLTGPFSRDAWETWCQELSVNAGIDLHNPDITFHWYAKEAPYLDKIGSLYPGHVMHLLNRCANGISSTRIRENLKQYRREVHPVFLNYLETGADISAAQKGSM